MSRANDEVSFIVCGPLELQREMRGVLDLQARLLTGDRERNADYLRWKYWENPAAADSFVVLALARGEVVGMRGFMGHRWQVGEDRLLRIPLSGDTVVSRAWEGRGLVHAMNRVADHECRRRGIRFLSNMGAGWAIRLQSLRSGWREAAQAAVLERAPQIRADRREEMCSKAGVSMMGLRVTLHPSLPEGVVSELAVLARPPRRPIAVRTASQYWQWRLRSPLSRYEFLAAYAGGNLAGALVMARAWYDPPAVIHAAQWLVRDETVLCCLFRAASDAYAGARISLWANSLDAGEMAVARSMGFVPPAEPRDTSGMPRPAVLLRSCGSDSADAFVVNGVDLLDGLNWDFQMLSSDAL
jgi:hypothetical protein